MAEIEKQLDRLQHALLNTQIELQELGGQVAVLQKVIDRLMRSDVREEIHGWN